MKTEKPDYCPEWFSLEKYENLNTLTRFDWHYLLYDRANIFTELSNNEIDVEDFEIIKYFLTKEISSPYAFLRNKTENNKPKTIVSFPLNVLDKIATIKKIEGRSRYNFYKSTDDKKSRLAKLESDLKESGYLRLEVAKQMNLSISEVGAHFLCINGTTISFNPFLSDKQIIDEFTHYLKEWRNKQNSDLSQGNRFSDNEIKSLIENKVLPYIDLTIWGMLTKNKLTHAQIANLIFPDLIDVDVVAKLRQTTIKKANIILGNNTPKFL